MIVRVIKEDKYDSFYEGDYVNFHEGINQAESEKEFLEIRIESAKNSITIEIEKNKDIKVFIMNDNGKTIEKKFI